MHLRIFMFAGLAAAAFTSTAWAMPNFARANDYKCTMCHTSLPKLNKTGYDFRSAGFRKPENIGKDEKAYNFSDYFTARLQERYIYEDKKNGKDSSKSFTSNNLEFYEVTLYPLSGPFGKYFASLGELSLAPGDTFEIENAYVRGVYGDENGWFQARLGVMHPWEGSGASDRPLGNTRPLFEKSAAVGSPFYLWNLDESAAEIGYNLAKTGTSISFRYSNGLVWKKPGIANNTSADPAQGGEWQKVTSDGYRIPDTKSLQVFANQYINGEKGAVSVYYYNGGITYPALTSDMPLPATPQTKDTFWRAAAFANYWVLEDLNVLAGYEEGNDSLGSADGIAKAAQIGRSWGYFGEFNYDLTGNFAAGFRYDYFDPSKAVQDNEQTAYTVFGNYYFQNGLQSVVDYRHKITKDGPDFHTTDDYVEARFIYIW